MGIFDRFVGKMLKNGSEGGDDEDKYLFKGGKIAAARAEPNRYEESRVESRESRVNVVSDEAAPDAKAETFEPPFMLKDAPAYYGESEVESQESGVEVASAGAAADGMADGRGNDGIEESREVQNTEFLQNSVSHKKTDAPSERPKFITYGTLTFRLSDDQIEFLSKLEREIMKRRSSRNRGERVTKNSILRAVVYAIMDLDIDTAEIRDETELLSRFRKAMGKRTTS